MKRSFLQDLIERMVDARTPGVAAQAWSNVRKAVGEIHRRVAGHEGAGFKQGQHLVMNGPKTSLCNRWLSVLRGQGSVCFEAAASKRQRTGIQPALSTSSSPEAGEGRVGAETAWASFHWLQE
ncbi:MAG: hypothetical protein AAF989_10355 [Planctomycetota bacterium]